MPVLAPSPELFVNWITGQPIALSDTASDIFANVGGWFNAQSYGVLASNSAAVNTTNFNTLITAVNTAGGGFIFLPRGQINLNNLNTITAGAAVILGQGSFIGGTELIFNNITEDCITFGGGASNQRIQGVYITSNVIRTSGNALLFSNVFRPTVRDVRIDFHFNGIYVKLATEILIEDITLRKLIGTRGILGGGTTGDLINGWRLSNIAADNPYPVNSPTVANVKTWAITTVFVSGDVVLTNGNIYQCSTGGTSAGAGTGPSGVPGTGGANIFTTTILDGTVQWKYVCNGGLTWLTQDSGANSLSLRTASLINGFQGFSQRDGVASGTSFPTWAEIFNLEVDHSYGTGLALNAGTGFYGSMLWVGSNLTANGINIGSSHKGSVQIIGARILGNAQHGVLLNVGPVNTVIIGCEIALNGQQTANTFHGIAVAANTNDFTIEGNSSGFAFEGSGQQNTGILVNGGTSDHYIITNNRLRGNVTAGLNDGGGGANKTVTGNVT